MADPPGPASPPPEAEGDDAQVHLGHIDLALAVLKWSGDGSNAAAATAPASTSPPFPPPPADLAATPLYLERGAGGKTVLASEDGRLVLGDPTPPPPSDGGGDPRRTTLTPLQATGRVAIASGPLGLAAEGFLTGWAGGAGRGAGAAVRLDLYLPSACFGELTRAEAGAWSPNPAAAALWAWLRDPVSGRAPGEGAAEAARPSGTPLPSPPSLAALLDALPPRPPDPPRRAGPGAAGVGRDDALTLLSLPPELLRRVTAALPDPCAVAAAAASCGALRDAASDAVPGLGLTLFPHQRAAVRWMAERERAPAPVGAVPSPSDDAAWHPAWRPLHWRQNKGDPPATHPPPLWACYLTGALSPDRPRRAAGARGGLLCDEPGLGKTITALALILRTRGRVPAPPPHALSVVRGPAGAFYTEAVDDEGEEGREPSPSTPAAPTGATRRPGAPPRRAAAIAAAEAGARGRRSSAEDAALVRARAAVASAAVTAAAARRRPCASLVDAQPAARRAASPAPLPSSSEGGAATTTTTTTTTTAPPLPPPTTKTWVQCDLCHKWRALPPGTPAPADPGAAWVCALHPDTAWASCGVAEEADGGLVGGGGERAGGAAGAAAPPPITPAKAECGGAAGRPTLPPSPGEPAASSDPVAEAYWDAVSALEGAACVGFIAPGGGGGGGAGPPPDPANVAHFRALLAADPALADWPSVAWWLAGLPPGALASPHGARVPREHRSPPGRWAAFLRALNLEPAPAPAPPPRVPAKRTRGGVEAPPPRRPPPPTSDAAWASVRAPAPLARLVLDAAALRSALLGRGRAPTRHVFLSPGTLLVVPPSLEAHWTDQVTRHVAHGALRVRVLTGGGGGGGHEGVGPCGPTGDAPSAAELAWGSDVVITTFARLSAEWGRRGGWVASAAAPAGGGGRGGGAAAPPARLPPDRAAPLLHVHWARILIDEGHFLGGGGGGLTSRLAMACALRAGSRWVMTGTPTPGGGRGPPASSDALSRLHPLLAFLHHDPFGAGPASRRAFDALVARPWDARSPAGPARAAALLGHAMIRASKTGGPGAALLPRLRTSTTRVRFSAHHAAAYNTLVDGIDRSLLLADWGDPDHRESLLNARLNGRLAREVAANVRLSCCVAGAVDLVVSEDDLRETLELLATRHGLAQPAAPPTGPPWVPADHPLARIEAGLRGGAACDACAGWTRLPIVTPCAHLVCVECAAPARTACAVCATPFAMQAVDDPARKETNPRPKWPVPLSVIEDQPAYAQAGAGGGGGGGGGGRWAPRWQRTPTSKVGHLVARLVELGVAPPPPSPASPFPASVHTPAAKAIVFTQFWPHLLLIGHALDAAGVHSVTLQGKMSPSQRSAAVDEFRFDDAAGVLVMDASGAVGLDLSFASHVFLMEPLPDAALEAQVIARAWRMGGAPGRTVHVQTLVMAGTVEEEVLAQRQAEEVGGGGAGVDPPAVRGRAAFAAAAAAAGQPSRGGSDAERAAARMRLRILSHLRRVEGVEEAERPGAAAVVARQPSPPVAAVPPPVAARALAAALAAVEAATAGAAAPPAVASPARRVRFAEE